MGSLLRLNAHQATLVQCKLQFSHYFVAFLVAWLLVSLDYPTNNKEEKNDEFQEAPTDVDEDEKLKALGTEVKYYARHALHYFSQNILVVSCAIYAVLFQRYRWLMVPWLMAGVVNLLVYSFLFVAAIMVLANLSQIMASVLCSLCTVIALYLLGKMVYSLKSGIASFHEIGAANKDALNIPSELGQVSLGAGGSDNQGFIRFICGEL